jgi:glycosyltransferase involved in cell wall biosynthesis
MRRSADGGAKLIAPVDDRHLDGAELTVHALAELASAHPGASLTLLGPLAEQSRVGLEQSAERLGVGDRVSFVERAEDAAYWDLVGSADLVVQVQERSDGEPWPMISDSIAARVPALVSDVGWAREIPDPAVLHLPHDYQPAQLGELFANALDDRSLRQRIHDAQDEYAAESSFTRVGTRCADLLGL